MKLRVDAKELISVGGFGDIGLGQTCFHSPIVAEKRYKPHSDNIPGRGQDSLAAERSKIGNDQGQYVVGHKPEGRLDLLLKTYVLGRHFFAGQNVCNKQQ